MIKYLVMDVDGTLTDGKIYMGNDGEAMKAFSIKDGCGIHDILIPDGITPVIITGRTSKIVENRCKEIGIREIHQGVSNKIKKLLSITSDLSSVAYVGDDITDLSCMKPIVEAGGLVGCPYDAADEVKEVANYICKKKGGEGAVRDFIKWLVKEKKKVDLSAKVQASIDYVKSLDYSSLPVGKYDISDETYFMVQEYITKKEKYCKLESHKKYIDVQWIISGSERMKTTSVNLAEPDTPYDLEKDVAFWKPSDNMMESLLSAGSYVVLYPDNAHMPSIANGEQGKVRKIVIKVKI